MPDWTAQAHAHEASALLRQEVERDSSEPDYGALGLQALTALAQAHALVAIALVLTQQHANRLPGQ